MRVFLSHAWTDHSADRIAANPRRGLVHLLRDALLSAGADVFFDEDEIEALDDIQARIRDGLGASTLLVCWYSDEYRERRACHWELLAGITSDASRVVVVNPEPGVDHVLPASLRNTLIAQAPGLNDAASWAALGQRIVELGNQKEGTFGAPRSDVTCWLGDAPARFARFVGRASQLWELDSFLRPAHALSGGAPAPAALVLSGLGGVGKTALALEYAARFAGAYPRGVFWLRAQGDEGQPDDEEHLEVRRASAFQLLATQLESTADATESPTREQPTPDVEATIRSHLAGGEYLWVIDSFPAGQAANALRHWLPPGGEGCVIVTTRGTTYRHLPNLSLEVMAPNEAIELLQSAASAKGEDETMAALAEKLDYLPLALEAVGGAAAVPGTSPAELLAELGDPLTLVEAAAQNAFASASPTEHTLSLTETFAPSLSRLDPPSLTVLAVAAMLNVGPLPTAVIRPVTAAITDVPASAFSRALGTLLSRSLVRRVDSETFELHGLVASATLQWTMTSDAERRDCGASAEYFALNALGDVEDIGTHGAVQRIARFAEGLALSASHGGGGIYEVPLLRSLGRFMHVEERYDEAIALERRGAALAAELSEEDPRTALAAQLNLALSLHHAGSPDAKALVHDAIGQLEARFGADDLDVLTAKHNLAGWSTDSEAKTLGKQVYDARRRLLGDNHPHTLFSLHSLLTQELVPERYTDSVAAYEDLIARRSTTLGADHTTTLTSIAMFVTHLTSLGRGSDAVPLARRLAERRAALYGPDHPRTLAAKGNLMMALASLDEAPHEEIGALAHELGAFIGDVSATPHGDLESVISNLSNVSVFLQKSGAADVAVRLLEAARPRVVAYLGPSAPMTLLFEHNRAAALAADGQLDAARDSFTELLERMRETRGSDDPLVLRAQRQQAIIAVGLGETSHGLDQQKRLAHIWENRAGPSSPELAEALGDIADTLARAGKPELARQFRERQRAIGAGRSTGLLVNWV